MAREDTQFKPGNPGGPGRPKGLKNKITRKAKKAIETILDVLIDDDDATEDAKEFKHDLLKFAKKNKAIFYDKFVKDILPLIVPKNVKHSGDDEEPPIFHKRLLDKD